MHPVFFILKLFFKENNIGKSWVSFLNGPNPVSFAFNLGVMV